MNLAKKLGHIPLAIHISVTAERILCLSTYTMSHSSDERKYHSYLRTFGGDFMDIEYFPGQSPLGVPAPTNVEETEKAYRIQMALPGYSRDQIHLEVANDVLVIKAEALGQRKEETKKYHKHEIFSTSFQRSILLPEDVNDDDIRASLKDGLLNIELPRSKHPVKASVEISIR